MNGIDPNSIIKNEDIGINNDAFLIATTVTSYESCMKMIKSSKKSISVLLTYSQFLSRKWNYIEIEDYKKFINFYKMNISTTTQNSEEENKVESWESHLLLIFNQDQLYLTISYDTNENVLESIFIDLIVRNYKLSESPSSTQNQALYLRPKPVSSPSKDINNTLKINLSEEKSKKTSNLQDENKFIKKNMPSSEVTLLSGNATGKDIFSLPSNKSKFQKHPRKGYSTLTKMTENRKNTLQSRIRNQVLSKLKRMYINKKEFDDCDYVRGTTFILKSNFDDYLQIDLNNQGENQGENQTDKKIILKAFLLFEQVNINSKSQCHNDTHTIWTEVDHINVLKLQSNIKKIRFSTAMDLCVRIKDGDLDQINLINKYLKKYIDTKDYVSYAEKLLILNKKLEDKIKEEKLKVGSSLSRCNNISIKKTSIDCKEAEKMFSLNTRDVPNDKRNYHRPNTPISQTDDKIKKWLASKGLEHFNQNDQNLISTILIEKNRYLLASFDLYLSDNDMLEFVDTVKRIVVLRKNELEPCQKQKEEISANEQKLNINITEYIEEEQGNYHVTKTYKVDQLSVLPEKSNEEIITTTSLNRLGSQLDFFSSTIKDSSSKTKNESFKTLDKYCKETDQGLSKDDENNSFIEKSLFANNIKSEQNIINIERNSKYYFLLIFSQQKKIHLSQWILNELSILLNYQRIK